MCNLLLRSLESDIVIVTPCSTIPQHTIKVEPRTTVMQQVIIQSQVCTMCIRTDLCGYSADWALHAWQVLGWVWMGFLGVGTWVGDLDRFLGWVSWVVDLNGFLGRVSWPLGR